MEIWEKHIKPNSRFLDFNLRELISYKDLLLMYIRRDIITFYKQTILGPAWFVIQPILTTVLFMLVFQNLAGLSTDGIPGPLFYFSGVILWNYFADCLKRNSKIFIDNQHVFGKVYFPRLVVPISITISNLVKFFIQFLVFIIIYLYYFFQDDMFVIPNVYLSLLPFLIILAAGLSLGFSIIFSSLTTKYRDLTFLLEFGIQLWMFITPVIYPLNSIPVEKHWIFALNPMTPVIETFKFAAIGQGVFSWLYLAYSFVFMIILLFLGMIIFNKIEKGFMDTV